MAENATPNFKLVVLAEAGGIHRPFVDAAKVWLDKQAAGNNFSVDYIQDTDKIDDAFLSRYQVFIQLNYPPYGWTPTAMAAFTKYIEEGRGGSIGFHHATLLGEFDGYPMWPWFSQFMGGIRFTDYIPKFVGDGRRRRSFAPGHERCGQNVRSGSGGVVHLRQIAAPECARFGAG